MELQCLYCKSGRAVLVDGTEWVCDSCGTILDTPELYDMSHPYLHTDADTDIPLEYKNAKDKPVVFIEREYGRSTKTTRKNQELKVPIVDREAVMIRIEQKDMVKSSVCDISEKLDLNPEKVLNKFESYIKKVGINDMLKTDNILTNKRHKRLLIMSKCKRIFQVFLYTGYLLLHSLNLFLFLCFK